MTQDKKNLKIVIFLGIFVVAMFGFGYATVPLYNTLCQTFGFNGKTMKGPVGGSAAIDYERVIKVQFVATNNAELPWKFYPLVNTINVYPGQNVKIAYFAENDSDKTMTIQAVPSVSPGAAAKYLKKTECFCFTKQTLPSKAAMEMPLLFHLDTDLPKDIKIVTLSYTIFDVTNMKTKVPASKQGKIT